MPFEDFTHPEMQDAQVANGKVVPGTGTQCNKNWWDNTLFAWVLGMVKNSAYTNITPADLIEKYQTGKFPVPLQIQSRSIHTDGGDENNTSVYITSSLFMLDYDGDKYVWNGGWLQFASGTHVVGPFTQTNAYKRIHVGVIENGEVLEIHTIEGEESMSPNPPAPGGYTGLWYYAGYIIVQNNGTTGISGQILPITENMIHSSGLTYISPDITSVAQSDALVWNGDGFLITIDEMDGIRHPYCNGTITGFLVTCSDTGSGGDDLIVQLVRSTDNTVICSITISANSGLHQLAYSQDLNVISFINNQYFHINIISSPTDSKTISARMFYNKL